tara:strand:- start:32809 stop:34134 length:1326 start_codon:yes stop_codon:yes gene_type:complete
MPEDLSRYIIRRGRRYSYRRRVPTDLVDILGREVKISLKTDSYDSACLAVGRVNESVIGYWDELRASGKVAGGQERYERARDLAVRLGWRYQQSGEIAEAPAKDVVARLESLETVDDRRVIDAVLGAIPMPRIMVSTLFNEYEQLSFDARIGKSPRQVELALNPHRRSQKNLLAVIGDKPIAELSRQDALQFRSWWSDRLRDENLSVKSANKEVNCLRAMFRVVSDARLMGVENPFKGIAFRNHVAQGKSRGETVSRDWIVQTLLAPGCLLDGINDEARHIVAILAETGARPGEICGLEQSDFVLGDPIPYIKIRPNQIREIKTSMSIRNLPLVGAALPAAKALVVAGGIVRYRGKNGSFTTGVNKFLRENAAFETNQQSLYSLRHALQDRFIAVEAPDMLVASVMGHKFTRPKYGAGPTLEQKQEWLARIALMPPSLNQP